MPELGFVVTTERPIYSPVPARKLPENLFGRLPDAIADILVSLYDDYKIFSELPVDRSIGLTDPNCAL